MNLHISPISGTPVPTNGRGRPKNSLNLYSKQPSSIATRLKKAGIDWVIDLASALKTNDLARINVWMRLLPYLIVTQSSKNIKRPKGKTSKAALSALEALENRE